eukprot:TRINITY_DN105159_c0_g1_i1.p1 TRINITY_DN105159_c0_g1~~TRINITY_DN105159_c0_g1_i1.p1  ORF type:complete len:263 (+),score=40.69 TRINITY_DN105159_c0_g1_i1:96-884(+)
MGSYSRLHVPVILGSIKDRWFAVLKPPGFAGSASPPAPSLEATFAPFLEKGRSISVPIRPEKDAQGIAVATTDDAMRKSFDELMRRRQIKSKFRMIVDVSSLIAGNQEKTSLGDGPLLAGGVLRESGRLTLSPPGTSPKEVCEFELESGPSGLQTALYIVKAKASTSSARQVRARFAEAGGPVLFDSQHHPGYQHRDGHHVEPALPQNQTLAMQLCELKLPDPFRPDQLLRLAAPMPPEWLAFHPVPGMDTCRSEDSEDMFA